ncbi:uncharacterized protein NECHADRAFT_106143 [Fusarium vanettenii 77-13-4]|uniref:Uncharacterized protein n=1 Tax=Fusarium vanettenii (strain ATCC MYA-4622 / CBS 123669 / FGSC 9596 / NRRL 45880 / 77-13-4) TaxID=660122 RepID=C7YS79_FUSV7|nr:uncharacterized protein NECHADRAFT_106143 [Fusarium vanettenii 77-13-4]EEU45588.1 hypothetical protein NECHADRAFT_106143 [Fusarium vanettenii 77-13-4]
MSDNIDPRENEKRLIAMADLNRLRQEELPLSAEEKRGPSFNPTRRNGTDHINPALKEGLSNKWTVKIDDEESRQTEGLEIENARPWGKEKAREFLETRGYTGAPSVTLAQWGPQNTTPAPEQPLVATQKVDTVSPKVQHESNGNVPEAAGATPASTNLKFILNTMTLDPTLAEHVIGTGQCQVVPGKDEALSFAAELVMKLLISENRAVLELSALGKPRRAIDALELGSPVIDGQFCAFAQLSNGGFFYLRFADESETKKFKRHLSKMQKSARAHQPQEKTGEVGQQQTDQQQIDQEILEQQQLEPQQPDQQQSDQQAGSVVSLANLNDDLEPLISMNGWTTVDNNQALNLENATRHVVVLVNRMLAKMTPKEREMALKEEFFQPALEGITDGIIEHWVQNGFFRGYNDSLKNKFCDLLQGMVQFQIDFLRRQNEGFKEKDQGVQQATQGVRALSLRDAPASVPSYAPQQRAVSHQQGHSTSASLLGTQLEGCKGLSASRYASGRVEFANCFTGTRIKKEQ